MSQTRYNNRKTFVNEEEVHDELRSSRDRKQIGQYETPRLRDISDAQRSRLGRKEHIWSHGDKYWKLASRYYNDPQYWWVIAWFNYKPTEAHCKIGDTIQVPFPIDKVVKYYSQ